MTSTRKSLLKIMVATGAAAALVWLLWPAGPAGPAPTGELPPATVEGEVGAETPLDLSTEPLEEPTPPLRSEPKLPAPNPAELVRLHEEALAGNRQSLEEICRYVIGADLYNLGDFRPSDELVSACAELRPDEEE